MPLSYYYQGSDFKLTSATDVPEDLAVVRDEGMIRAPYEDGVNIQTAVFVKRFGLDLRMFKRGDLGKRLHSEVEKVKQPVEEVKDDNEIDLDL